MPFSFPPLLQELPISKVPGPEANTKTPLALPCCLCNSQDSGTTDALGNPLVQVDSAHVSLLGTWVWKVRSKEGNAGLHTGRQCRESQ